MRFSALLLSLFIASGILSGCKSTSSHGGTDEISQTAPIDVYRDGAKPAKPYREIGQLTDDGKEIEQPEIEAKMIEKAKRMGGQAIIFETPKESGMEPGFFTWGFKYTYLYKATVIVYE